MITTRPQPSGRRLRCKFADYFVASGFQIPTCPSHPSLTAETHFRKSLLLVENSISKLNNDPFLAIKSEWIFGTIDCFTP